MAKLPRLESVQSNQDICHEFLGYNHNMVIRDNEFFDMENMSSSGYPVMMPRKRRGLITKLKEPKGVFAKNRLCWVEKAFGEWRFFYNGITHHSWKVSADEKQFISIGSQILIWPDKKYFDITKIQEPEKAMGSLGAKWESDNRVEFSLCKLDGTSYEDYIRQPTAPKDPENGLLWMDTSVTPNSLKQYAADRDEWMSIATTYIKIAARRIGNLFKQYDGITISGCSVLPDLNTDSIIMNIDPGVEIDGQRDSNYIIVVGLLNDSTHQEGKTFTVERRIPDMEFLTESENRVWGCNSQKHEIYCCKLGDPTNWNCYMGLSTDSYAVTIGTDGNFTGACTHLGYVLFFKEDCIHKIYGNRPSNFQVTNSHVRGVERGSEKSLVIVNERLYFKSRNGICVYDGSLPSSISHALGDTPYKNAVAGTLGNKYYVSMQSADGWTLFAYDEAQDIWHREDDTHVQYFTRVRDELFFIDAESHLLKSVNGTYSLYNNANGPAEIDGTVIDSNKIEWYDPENEEATSSDDQMSTKNYYCAIKTEKYVGKLEDEVEWMVLSGDMGAQSIESKYLSRLHLRLQVDEGSTIMARIRYNSDNEDWTEHPINAPGKKVFTIPIVPRRCDHLALQLRGTGPCKIYSISKYLEEGSDLS